MVWPSLFGDGLPDYEGKRIGLDKGHLPDWKGPNQGLWDDLSQMRTSLGPRASEPHVIVAVSWVSEDGFSNTAAGAGPYKERMIPPTISAGWQLLGFDVADAGLTSGLSNCGYPQSEIAGLRASWVSDLNEHHLFTDVQRAFAFRDLTDRRVSDHAPFFVYSLWLIDSQTRGA